MGKKGKKNEIVIQKSTIESVLMVLFIVVLTFIGLKFMLDGVKNVSNIEPNEELLSTLGQGAFNDSELNLVMLYPSKWVLTQIDSDIIEMKKEVVSKSSNGGIFDITAHRLTEEIVSMLVVSDANLQEDGSNSHSQFLSVSLMGDVENMEKEEKLEVLTNRFKENINMSNPEDTKEIEVIKSSITPDGDFYIEINVDFETGSILYGMYSKVIGKNIVTGIIGSNINDELIYDKLENVINSIKSR